MVDGVGGAGDGDSSSAAVPAWFAEFAAQVDKRFEGIASKLKAPTAEPGSSPAPQQQPDVGELVRSAMAYGELRSGLTEAARARLDTLQEQGLSYAQLTLVAETLRSIRAPANGAITAERSAPTGLAATPAPSVSAPTIRTISELRALKAKSEDAYRAWMADPANDPSKLHNR